MTTLHAKGRDPAGFVIAGLLLLAAAVIAWDANSLELSSPYGLGPKAMPFAIAVGLAVLAVANLIMSLRGDLPVRESMKLAPVALILGGFAALVALIGLGGGFIPATAILFAATSTAFGRRAIVADLVIGLVLGIVIFLLFDKLLTLSLPAGPLERLL
jgi:putative tricarboxylic transport membrane protein